MKTTFLTASLLLAFGAACFGETVDGHLMPLQCKNDDPNTHTAACALKCQSSGFGVVTAEGSFLRFTHDGNKRAIAMLQSSGKTANLQVSVQGKRQGKLLAVETIAWK